jgi:hypothetical protein
MKYGELRGEERMPWRVLVVWEWNVVETGNRRPEQTAALLLLLYVCEGKP